MKKTVLIRLEYPGIMGMDSGECRRKGTAINGVVQVMKRSVKFERLSSKTRLFLLYIHKGTLFPP